MYRVIHEVQGPRQPWRYDDFSPFRSWREAVAEAKRFAAFRSRAVRPRYPTIAVEVVNDDGEVVWSSREPK